MTLIYKNSPGSRYERILRFLQERYPDKKFKILTSFLDEVYYYEYGIAVKTGWFRWQELDLEAMDLLPFNERPDITPSPNR
jgi:hypothetical protein